MTLWFRRRACGACDYFHVCSGLSVENNCVVWLPTHYDPLWMWISQVISLYSECQPLRPGVWYKLSCPKIMQVSPDLTATQYDPLWKQSLSGRGHHNVMICICVSVYLSICVITSFIVEKTKLILFDSLRGKLGGSSGAARKSKTTFDVRLPSMEDYHQWKTTFDGRRHEKVMNKL